MGQQYKKTPSNYWLQCEMMSLNCLAVLTQVYIFKIKSSASLKKYETLSTNPPIHVYINRISNRLMSKIRDGYKL